MAARLEGVDQLHQRPVQAVDGVAVPGGEFGEELVAGDLFLVLVYVLGAVRQDHVVQPLVGGARDLGVLDDDVEVLVERPLPVLLAVVAQVRAGGGARRGSPSRWPSQYPPRSGRYTREAGRRAAGLLFVHGPARRKGAEAWCYTGGHAAGRPVAGPSDERVMVNGAGVPTRA